jgi:hypothetical protein
LGKLGSIRKTNNQHHNSPIIVYLQKNDLKREIEHWGRTGELTPALTQMLIDTINGTITRYYRGNHKEDLSQDCFVHILNKLHLVQPDKNSHAYLTQLVRNCCQQAHAKELRYWHKLRKYSTTITLPEA